VGSKDQKLDLKKWQRELADRYGEAAALKGNLENLLVQVEEYLQGEQQLAVSPHPSAFDMARNTRASQVKRASAISLAGELPLSRRSDFRGRPPSLLLGLLLVTLP
jgi:hypothetical protein